MQKMHRQLLVFSALAHLATVHAILVKDNEHMTASTFLRPVQDLPPARPEALQETSAQIAPVHYALAGQAATTRVGAPRTVEISLGFILGLVVGSLILFFIMRRRQKSEDAAPAAEESKAEEEQKTEQAPKNEEEEPIDYEKMIRLIMRKAAQRAGPTLTKGSMMKKSFEDLVSSFPEKAKALVLNELNGLAANVAKAMGAEEAMLLVEWDEAVLANFPPMAVLLAGILSPSMLTAAISNNVIQIFAVLLPVALLCIWALITDMNVGCSIPGIKLCVFVQALVAVVLIVCRIAVTVKAKQGQRQIQEKMEQMQKRIENATSNTDIFVSQAVVLQTGLLAEDHVRRSFFNHMVCIGTLTWIIVQIWNLVLIIGWSFIPGVTAFHPGAEGHADGNFCGAWATVLAARISTLVAVLFFLLNIALVAKGIADMLILYSPSFAMKVLGAAKQVDKGMMDLPVTQVLVKAFFLRGSTDCAAARLAVSLHEKADLLREKSALKSQLDAVEGKIKNVESTVKDLEGKAAVEGNEPLQRTIELLQEGDFVEKAESEWKEAGKNLADQAIKTAQDLQEATTVELEAMMQKIQEMMVQIQESQQYKDALVAADTAAHKAMEVADTAAHKAMEVADTAAAKARDLMEQTESVPDLLAKLKEASSEGLLPSNLQDQLREAASQFGHPEQFIEHLKEQAAKSADPEALQGMLKEAQDLFQHAAEKASEQVSGHVSGQVSEQIPEQASPEQASEQVPEQASKQVPEQASEQVPEHASK